MFTSIYVDFTAEDTFELTDRKTRKVVMVKSAEIHDPCYITRSLIESHFLSKFGNYDEASFFFSDDALTRINSIMEFNAIDDRW